MGLRGFAPKSLGNPATLRGPIHPPVAVADNIDRENLAG